MKYLLTLLSCLILLFVAGMYDNTHATPASDQITYSEPIITVPVSAVVDPAPIPDFQDPLPSQLIPGAKPRVEPVSGTCASGQCPATRVVTLPKATAESTGIRTRSVTVERKWLANRPRLFARWRR